MTRDFLAMLEGGYRHVRSQSDSKDLSRLAFLGAHIFDFTTYDDVMDERFAKKAVEVCEAITQRTTFEYIKHEDNYQWYLIMVNMPFFLERLNWGTSIRGAFWDGPLEGPIRFQSCGLWDGDVQVYEDIEMNVDEWKQFVAAIIDFSRLEELPNK